MSANVNMVNLQSLFCQKSDWILALSFFGLQMRPDGVYLEQLQT